MSERKMGLRVGIWRDELGYLEPINTVSTLLIFAIPSWSASSTSWYV